MSLSFALYSCRRLAPVLRRVGASRSFCTDFKDSTPHFKEAKWTDDPDKTPLKEEFLDADGNVIFECGKDTKFDESYDWAPFEKAFDLDKLLNNLDQEPEPKFDEVTEEFELDFSKLSEIACNVERNYPEIVKESRSFQKELNAIRDSSDTPDDPSPVDGTLPKSQLPSLDEESPMRSSTEAPHGVTRKLKRASSSPSSSTHKSVPNVTPPSLPEHALRLPESARRPGYERRLQTLEAQMERIAVEVLCAPDAAWVTAGGELERVMLTPNGQTLILQFTRVDRDEKDSRLWQKTCKTAARAVRLALANGLHAKRVPKVVFERVSESSLDNVNGPAEIEKLFERIAHERENEAGEKSRQRNCGPLATDVAG